MGGVMESKHRIGLEKFVNFSDLRVLRRERYVTFKYDIMVGVEVAFDPPCWMVAETKDNV